MEWKLVDKELLKYINQYKKKQYKLKDNIQNIFNLNLKDLNGYLKLSDLSRFKRYLEENRELVKNNDYVAYMVNKYIKKVKVTTKDMLKVMLLVEYAKFEDDISENQLDTLDNIAEYAYEEAVEMCEAKGFRNIRPRRINWIDSFVLALTLTPLNVGYTYKEQNDSNAIYNAEEVYKQALLDISQDNQLRVDNSKYTSIFDKQLKREINQKKSKDLVDKFSGYLDNMSTFVINQILLEVFKDFEVEKVQFKGLEDEKQTLMCQTLNNQVFFIDKMNVYDRYSADDKKNVIYHSEGMVLGENLPPITNHFHWCRSHIEPYKEL